MKLVNQAIASISAAIASANVVGSATSQEKKLMLFKNNIVPNRETVAGDLVEADFGGYAQVVMDDAVGQTGRDPLSGLEKVSVLTDTGNAIFRATNAITGPQTVYGFALVNSADELLAYHRFEDPITFVAEGDMIDVTSLLAVSYDPVAFE